MGEIPEDVQREAELAADNIAVSSQHPALNPALDGFYDSVLREAIILNSARAILAERERCVKWVADHQTRSNGDPLDPSMPDILYAIRTGATHG